MAEKGVHQFRLTTRGTAGHASNPRFGDNALLKLAPLIGALGEARPAFDVTEGPLRLLSELGFDAGDPAAALEALRAKDPILALIVEPALSVTFAPTITRASTSINVIPSDASVDVDCRTPPGVGEEIVLRRIAECLGEDGFEVEIIERVVGNGSPVDTPLMDAISGWMAREDPEARTVPVVLPAFTDSRTFRAAFPECVAYGFFPMRTMHPQLAASLIHSADERIHVEDLELGTRFLVEIARELLA